jgi:PAS domain S-box-containing protein
MSSKGSFAPPSLLRDEAEAQLARMAPITPEKESTHSAQALLHELQVHQIELEMQNEALRSVQTALEASRDRYFDLYEFAPIAYLTLGATGQITEINLTGATLLGDDRAELRLRRFLQFIVADDQGRWQQHFGHALKQTNQQACELRMQRRDGTIFNVCLSSSLTRSAANRPELRIALTDITAQKCAEEARRRFEARLHKLTRREREVLVLALAGMLNRDISAHLQVSQRTIENHRARIHQKTGAVTLLELAQQAAIAGVMLDDIALPRGADHLPSGTR